MRISDAYELKVNGKSAVALYADGRLIWGVPMVYVQELIDEGYAVVKECAYTGNVRNQGYSAPYYQIQILPSCPYKIRNIIDFDIVMTNGVRIVDSIHDNYFVWNEQLPDGWNHDELIGKYNGTTLDYVMSGMFGGTNPLNADTSTWFNGVDFSSVEEFTLVVDSLANWNSANAGLLVSRGGAISYKSPSKFTLKFLQPYSSAMQYLFGKLGSTKHIVLDLSESPVRPGGSGENLYCRDMAGLCEWDGVLETIEVKGRCLFCDGINISNAWHSCGKLRSIPLFAPNDAREGWWNTWPVTTIEQAFTNCASLVSIMPVLDMTSITYANACIGDGAFKGCTKLSDVRFKNITGSWDFTSDKCNLIHLSVDSINYILNNVKAVSGNTYTLRFCDPVSGNISEDAIAVAQSRGYNVDIVPSGKSILTESGDVIVSEDNKIIIL